MVVNTSNRVVTERVKIQEELDIILEKVRVLVKENQRLRDYVKILENEHPYYEHYPDKEATKAFGRKL